MARSGRNVTLLDELCVADAASASRLKCAGASLQRFTVPVLFHLMALHNLLRVLQYFLLWIAFGGRNSHSRRPSQAQNRVTIVFLQVAQF
jgi:hypothetical protein